MKFRDEEFDLSYSIEQKELMVKCEHSFLQVDGPLTDDVIRDNKMLERWLLDAVIENIVHVTISSINQLIGLGTIAMTQSTLPFTLLKIGKWIWPLHIMARAIHSAASWGSVSAIGFGIGEVDCIMTRTGTFLQKKINLSSTGREKLN
jgi:hypothetical protein